MRLQRFTHYLIAHRFLTALFVFLGTFIPVIGVIGILIAVLMTLRKGMIEGGLLAIAATFPYFISFYFSEREGASLIIIWAALCVAVFSNLATWIFAVMLKKQTNLGVILQIGALAGVLIISVIHLIYPDVMSWWGKELQSYYNEAKAMTSVLKVQEVNLKEMQLESINVTKQYATGFIVAGILFNAILQLIAARWWEAIVFYPGRLHKELQNIRLSRLAGILFILSVILSYLGNAVVLDIMPVLYLLFCGAGLSLVHYLFKQINSSTVWFWLLVFYVAFIISMPTSVILIAMIALLDIAVDIRKRFKKV